MFKTIHSKILFFQVLNICVVSFVSGFAAYFLMIQFLSRSQKQNIEYISQSKAVFLEHTISNEIEEFKNIANGEPVREYSVLHSDLILREYFDLFKEEFSELFYVNEQGDLELKVVNGELLHQHIKNSEKILFDETTWAPNKVFVRLDMAEEDNVSPHLNFGIYKTNYFDEFEGMVGAVVCFSQVVKEVESFHFGGGGFLMILDPGGRVLSQPVKGIMPPEIVQGINEEKLIETSQLIARESQRFSIWGLDSYVSYVPVNAGGLNLFVLAVIPYSEFMSMPYVLRNAMVIICFFLLVLGVFFARKVAFSIANPVKALTAASELMAKGELTSSVEVRAEDEVGVLTRSFNEMTAKVKMTNEQVQWELIERKAAQEEAYKIAQQWEATFNSIPEMISILDRDFQIVKVNKAYADIFKKKPEELIGMKGCEFIHGPDVSYPIEGCPYIKTLETGEESVIEIFEPHLGIHLHVATSPLFDQDGKTAGVVHIASDISERKKAEQNAEKHQEELEDMVRERTLKLELAKLAAEKAAREIAATHLDLKRAKLDAEEANNAKSQFLSNMSHEMRTPLNCIIGFTEIINEMNPVGQVHKRSVDILRESEILLKLINTLLDHTKIEEGKMELESLPVNISDLLQDVKNSFSRKVEEKGLNFQIIKSKDTPQYVISDSFRLRQVLGNLIGNAIKFTKEGSVSLEVARVSEGKDEVTLRFDVIDTGMGISKERQKVIFESFTQADGSTTREYGGSGLGTTIAQELVQLMGGEMGVESEEGKGSRFWFTVPFKRQREESETIPFEGPEPGEEKEIELQGQRDILLVEDYEPNQDLARTHLEDAGYSVTVAGDGLQALEICEDKRFDLILMDIQMPNLNGFDATRRLRKSRSPSADTLVVALTADVEAQTLEECKEAGMNDVITKPFRRKPFLEKVGQLLRKT